MIQLVRLTGTPLLYSDSSSVTPTAPADKRLDASPSPNGSFLRLGRVLVNRVPVVGRILFGVRDPVLDPGLDGGLKKRLFDMMTI